MKRACSIDTQNPSARMVLTSATRSCELLDELAHPDVIRRVDVGEGAEVVSLSPLPRHLGQVKTIMNAEVGERHEVLLVDGVPHPQLGRDPSIEVPQHVEPVSSFGRGRETEQFDWRHVIEKRPVRPSGRVVELVDDDDVEVAWVE